MPGTLVKDALEPELYDGTALAVADTATTGTAILVDKPGPVRVVCELGTLTGASTHLAIEIQGSDTSSFASHVSYGIFSDIGPSNDNETRFLDANVYKKYMRAILTTSGGGSPSYTPTVTVRQPNWHAVHSTDTA